MDLTEFAAQTFSYDANGNMLVDAAHKSYQWDATNRLVAINYLDTGNRTEFAYDGLGHRVKITEYGPGVTAVAQPADSNYSTFMAGPFNLPSGYRNLTLQGLNPHGGDNTVLVDSVTLNNVLMADGGFESPSVQDYQNDPTGTAWNFTGSAGVAANGGFYTIANPPAPEGTQVAFVKNDGLLSQNWSAVAGKYTLRLRAAQRGSGNDTYQQLRVNFRTSAAVTSVKTFVWCGNQICEERNSTGTNVTKRFFAEGEQRDGDIDAGNYYYSRDHLGSIREVTDASGSLKARYDYDPYGKSVVVAGSMSVDFGYTGHYFHAPSGLNLTLRRAYTPALGRWISRDPLVNAEMNQGPNLYQYVANDPTDSIDSLGLYYRNWTETETQNVFLRPAFIAATAGPLQGLFNIWRNSEGHGLYDFSDRREYEGDTFCVNGQKLDPWQFGNYIAGYQGAAYDLYVVSPVNGLGKVYLAGMYYHLSGQSREWNPLAGFPMITHGALDVARTAIH